MPNLFGKTSPLDYRRFEILHDKRGADALKAEIQRLEKATGKPLTFDALGAGADKPKTERTDPVALGYMQDSLTHLLLEAEEELYGETANTFGIIPIRSGIPEGAGTYQGRVYDYSGMGEFADTVGSVIPDAAVTSSQYDNQMRTGRINAAYTTDDIRAAVFEGVPLDAEMMHAAMIGAQNHIDACCVLGTKWKGKKGLFNLPTGNGANQVKLTNNSGNPWLDDNPPSPSEIRKFLQKRIASIKERTMGVIGKRITGEMCILLPGPQFNWLSTETYNDYNPEKTIMSVVENVNAWIKGRSGTVTFKDFYELLGAGVGAGINRGITYVKDSRVLEVGVAFIPRSMGMESSQGVHRTTLEYRFSPLKVKRFAGIEYFDRI